MATSSGNGTRKPQAATRSSAAGANSSSSRSALMAVVSSEMAVRQVKEGWPQPPPAVRTGFWAVCQVEIESVQLVGAALMPDLRSPNRWLFDDLGEISRCFCVAASGSRKISRFPELPRPGASKTNRLRQR